MTRMLLAAAGALAAIALSTAAQAQDSHGSRHHRGAFTGVPSDLSCAGAVRGDRARGRANCNSDVLMDVYGGEWALYNNRSWSPESYNDWWHDRPERAYPAWMRRNQDCSRQWYSGDTLRC
jgi:hypothetical protein